MRQLWQSARGLVRGAKWPVAGTGVATLLAFAATGSAAVNALVVGKVMNCGDPAHTACNLQRHAVVSAFNARHELVASETVTNGHFSFMLAPGHYSLSAKKPRGRSTRRPVTAEAHQTVSTKIIFNMGDFTN